MANSNLFSSSNSKNLSANTRNNAGGNAYSLDPKTALAQLAATGTFGNTFYCSANSQLSDFRQLIEKVDDNRFLAKLAIYSRQKAFMKDMPAAIVTVLASRDPALMHQVFDQVIDNGRMLRNVFQMVRSGQFGKRGLSSSLKRAFQRWFAEASVGKLISATVGNDPSLRDILRMARPKPKDNLRRALFGWLSGAEHSKWAPGTPEDLSDQVKSLLKYRSAESFEERVALIEQLPVRWDLLSERAKNSAEWKAITKKMGTQALRMNLNTMIRHGVFKLEDGHQDKEMVDWVAGKIGNKELVGKSRQFPYQYLAAYKNANSEISAKIQSSLHKAAEYACGNVPEFPGPIVIGVDTSASMQWPVTGWHGQKRASKVRCVDAAALFAAAALRKNPDSVVVPFDTTSHSIKIDPEDSILSVADRLGAVGGGGTDCSVPIAYANKHLKDRSFCGVVIISDNESWVYKGKASYYCRGTGVMDEWNRFAKIQKKNGVPNPKLICIDIVAGSTTQAPDNTDILNVGGFSDAVFRVVDSFLRPGGSHFVSEIESIDL